MSIEPDDKDWTWVLDRPCPECGYDASDHPRDRLGHDLRRTALRWRPLLDRPLADQRPRPDRWSALEYGAHVRDVFAICLGRLQLMLAEDDPTFANWDQDATATEEDYAAQDPFAVARELEAAAMAFADAYDAVADPQWSRTGTRSDGARFTIESFGRYVLHDPMHHVWDVEQGYATLEGREG
ncbi:MAG TPA: DinB family protein [Acidimicrobiales bacterium]|nr:DinB family protein [Acidimicrobiales bacterium]